MKKKGPYLKVYKSFEQIDKDDKEYWKKASMSDRVLARKQLWLNYCLLKGIDPYGLKLQRVLSVVKSFPVIKNKLASGRPKDLLDAKLLME